jgi:hypothetical protein
MAELKESLRGWNSKKSKLQEAETFKMLRRKKRKKLAAKNGNRSSSRFGNITTSLKGLEEVDQGKRMSRSGQSTSYQS